MEVKVIISRYIERKKLKYRIDGILYETSTCIPYSIRKRTVETYRFLDGIMTIRTK